MDLQHNLPKHWWVNLFERCCALKNVINEREIPCVGGNIQYGNFDNSYNFSTSGIVEYEYDAQKRPKKIKHCIAGINMNGDEFDPKDNELFIMGSYINPFNK